MTIRGLGSPEKVQTVKVKNEDSSYVFGLVFFGVLAHTWHLEPQTGTLLKHLLPRLGLNPIREGQAQGLTHCILLHHPTTVCPQV